MKTKTAMQEAIEKIEKMVSIRNFQQWKQLKKEFLAKEKKQIESYASQPMSAGPTVQQLREAAKNNPDTFLAGALYVIDNYKLNSPSMSAEQVEELAEKYADSKYNQAIHLIGWSNIRKGFIAGYNTAATAPTVNEGIGILTDLLVKHGGKIVSSNSLSAEWIAQARASNRMYVDNNSLGYIWEPEFKNGMPETVEEVELFEWCYPLETKLPESLKEFNPTVKAEGWVSVEEFWNSLTNEQRLQLKSCKGCGSLDTSCQCCNDD